MQLRGFIVPLFAAAALVIGCATTDGRFAGDGSHYGSGRSNEGYYAVIESIESRSNSVVGNAIASTIIGAVEGEVAGHQVESGRDNDAATVAGALGGGLIGHEIAEANGPQDVYFIRIRFDDRSYQTVAQKSLDGLRVGDSVRIERNRVRRY